jgi:hypothetical protein
MVKFIRGSKTTFLMPLSIKNVELLQQAKSDLQYQHLCIDTSLVDESTTKVVINSCAYSSKRILDRLNLLIQISTVPC